MFTPLDLLRQPLTEFIEANWPRRNGVTLQGIHYSAPGQVLVRFNIPELPGTTDIDLNLDSDLSAEAMDRDPFNAVAWQRIRANGLG